MKKVRRILLTCSALGFALMVFLCVTLYAFVNPVKDKDLIGYIYSKLNGMLLPGLGNEELEMTVFSDFRRGFGVYTGTYTFVNPVATFSDKQRNIQQIIQYDSKIFCGKLSLKNVGGQKTDKESLYPIFTQSAFLSGTEAISPNVLAGDGEAIIDYFNPMFDNQYTHDSNDYLKFSPPYSVLFPISYGESGLYDKLHNLNLLLAERNARITNIFFKSAEDDSAPAVSIFFPAPEQLIYGFESLKSFAEFYFDEFVRNENISSMLLNSGLYGNSKKPDFRAMKNYIQTNGFIPIGMSIIAETEFFQSSELSLISEISPGACKIILVSASYNTEH